MNRDREFSPAEIQHMRMAGVPSDRPGIGGEYPLMLYRRGEPEAAYLGEPFAIGGQRNVATLTVHSFEEEEAATAEGWKRTLPEPAKAAK